MKTIGTFEAKTHLSELLARVSKGESIRITRRGIPVAKLVPYAGEPVRAGILRAHLFVDPSAPFDGA